MVCACAWTGCPQASSPQILSPIARHISHCPSVMGPANCCSPARLVRQAYSELSSTWHSTWARDRMRPLQKTVPVRRVALSNYVNILLTNLYVVLNSDWYNNWQRADRYLGMIQHCTVALLTGMEILFHTCPPEGLVVGGSTACTSWHTWIRDSDRRFTLSCTPVAINLIYCIFHNMLGSLQTFPCDSNMKYKRTLQIRKLIKQHYPYN